MFKRDLRVSVISLCIALVGILLVCGASFTAKSHNENLFPNCDNVVKIVVDGYEWDWEGSGVFIEDDLILTAGHIVDGASIISIQLQDGTIYIADDWYLEDSKIGDIGFISVDTDEVEPTLFLDNALLGEDVWAFGNPFGVFPILTKGIISIVETPDSYLGGLDMLVTDCAINPGNSGCPLFDKDGNILGICSWGYTNSQGMSYFVTSKTILLSLEKYKLAVKIEELTNAVN